MAILAWIKSRKAFLKIQEGTGDNLSEEDIDDGMTSYVLWSVFCAECIDLDETLDMDLVSSGMLMFEVRTSAIDSLPGCYAMAFDKAYDESDVIILLQEEDESVQH